MKSRPVSGEAYSRRMRADERSRESSSAENSARKLRLNTLTPGASCSGSKSVMWASAGICRFRKLSSRSSRIGNATPKPTLIGSRRISRALREAKKRILLIGLPPLPA